MTVDHHDWELWERYFKPCNSVADLGNFFYNTYKINHLFIGFGK
jgi:hypothetical protein